MATRNRAGYIGEALDSVIEQAAGDVEIVIVDGASTDRTEEVVRLRQARFPGIRYFRQDSANGVDRDFSRAAELARGEYCWFMCDDDALRPGAIERVLRETREGYGLIVVNAAILDVELKTILEPRSLRWSRDRSYAPGERERLLADVAGYLSFIGGVVIRRAVWRSRERERYYGTMFLHVGVIFQAPLPEPALAIAEALVSIRYGNASWSGDWFDIWLFRWPSLIWSFDLPDRAKARVIEREPWRNLRALTAARAKGAYSLREYRRWISPRLAWSRQRLLAGLIAVLPGMPLNAAAWLYGRLFKPGSRVAMADIRNSPFYPPRYLRRLLSRGAASSYATS
ncbi:MAG: glycosyltransferase family 2 protein [Elusimicrobia bacterium]|nr:glycosyltransferase family 2 protein [Elusimicrobiota bacterium]